MPWIFTNWTGESPPLVEAAPLSPAQDLLSFSSAWRVEKHLDSEGQVTSEGEAVTLRYQLAAGERRSQFVAAVADVAPPGPLGRVSFTARAEVPMRVSVQLRYAPADLRWTRSIYLDSNAREFTVDVPSLRAADRSGQPTPSTPPRSLLFVVDLVNARPGDRGGFVISKIRAAGPS